MTLLDGWKVAISISDGPDRARLGYPMQEIDRALFSMCTALIRSGAKVVYSGDLRPSGYTFKMFRFLAGAYAGAGTIPFEHVIPEPVLRKMGFDALFDALKEGRSITATTLLIGGNAVPIRRSDRVLLVGERGSVRTEIADDVALSKWVGSFSPSDPASAYTMARVYVSKIVNARVAIGGKMGVVDDLSDHYSGARPGILEEAFYTLYEHKPLILLGAFGGATRDAAIALGLLNDRDRVPRKAQLPSYHVAIKEIEAYRANIPDVLRSRLAQLAADDRADSLSLSVVQAIHDWNALINTR